MRLRRLGKQGPEISVVGYGAWEIGGDSYGPNPEESRLIRAIEVALDAGMNWIDTAEVYGSGRSEEIVGKAIRGRRDDVLIATKVAPRPGGSGFRPEEIKRAVRGSLKRLRIDFVDLYQLHWWPGGDYPIEDSWGAMGDLIKEGLTRYIGVSNFERDQIQRCLAIRHCDSLQPEYSILHREEEDVITWCEQQGIGVIVYGPLAYGLLTGTITKETRFHTSDFRSGHYPDEPYYRRLFAPSRIETHLEVIERLRPIAGRLGVSLSQLALAWTFHQRGVTAAIAGSRSPDHNRENAAAGNIELTAADLQEIEEVMG